MESIKRCHYCYTSLQGECWGGKVYEPISHLDPQGRIVCDLCAYERPELLQPEWVKTLTRLGFGLTVTGGR